jgi:hypothetical protein
MVPPPRLSLQPTGPIPPPARVPDVMDEELHCLQVMSRLEDVQERLGRLAEQRPVISSAVELATAPPPGRNR